MKLIHLSDLHLGKRVNECSMLEDQQYILGEILRIIDSEAPDAVLIAGDVYDKSVPSAEAVTLLDDFLVQLASRRVQTCLISGNHDSAERLSFGGRLMDAVGIHIAPVYDGSLAPLTLSDEHGPVDIYLLPFLKPVQVRRFFPDEDIESYTDAMAAVLRAANVDTARRNVLVAHQFVTGAVPCESEELSVGGTDNVAVCVFDDFDYVALGHIHGPQKVGRETVRYCGTPLKYSFSEVSHKKSVTVVEIGEKGSVGIRTVPLVPRRDMSELRGTYNTLMLRENYEGNVFSCMGCRSFLSPWKDENGEYKWEGRFNQGVVSINLPQIGILAKGNEEKFWKLLDERLELCYEALMCRHKALEGVVSDVSPIHWQYGAIARLKKGETIDKYLHNGYSTMSLGYIGLYEMTYLMKGCSQTVEPGKEFALRVMDYMKDRCAKWKEETGIAFSLYGTPAETLCYRFARIDREKYGDISNVTDKGYYTNSYHVDVREKIDAFTKFKIESEFQNKSLGGAISYVEVPNLTNNVEAIEEVIRFIYDNIQYGEFNTKSDYCHVCGYDGEIMINDNMEWECPQCHNKDHAKMNVTRRTCGYLGENFWNAGKTKEIKARVLHL